MTRRAAALLTLWAVGALAVPAGAAGTAPVCRSGAVEWIVGGNATAPSANCQGAEQTAASPRRERAPQGLIAHAPGGADAERRRILEAELAQEHNTLAQQQRPGVAHADIAAVARTRANIVALQNELARTGPGGSTRRP